MANKNNKCTFCGRPESEVPLLLTGANGYICSDCVESAHQLLQEYMPGELANKQKQAKGKKAESIDLNKVPKPKEIKDYLDQYIIGQDAAKRYLSVAVYNPVSYTHLTLPTNSRV